MVRNNCSGRSRRNAWWAAFDDSALLPAIFWGLGVVPPKLRFKFQRPTRNATGCSANGVSQWYDIWGAKHLKFSRPTARRPLDSPGPRAISHRAVLSFPASELFWPGLAVVRGGSATGGRALEGQEKGAVGCPQKGSGGCVDVPDYISAHLFAVGR